MRKKEIPIDIGLERGFISRDNPNETIIGVFENGEIRYAEKASYDSIDPELDRELNKKKFPTKSIMKESGTSPKCNMTMVVM